VLFDKVAEDFSNPMIRLNDMNLSKLNMK
jgi:hypothetical protein